MAADINLTKDFHGIQENTIIANTAVTNLSEVIASLGMAATTLESLPMTAGFAAQASPKLLKIKEALEQIVAVWEPRYNVLKMQIDVYEEMAKVDLGGMI